MEDKLLIWKFRRGSRDALRRIYDKHHGHLLKLAVVLTGNVDAAEDVVQEVFVNFARSADRFGLFSCASGCRELRTIWLGKTVATTCK